MIAMLAVFVLLYSGLLGCWAVCCAARGTTLGLGYLGGLVLLKLTVLVRAGIEAARLVASSGGPHGEFGRGYAEPGVHAGYLLASIVVLPLVLTVTRATPGLTPSDDPGERTEHDHLLDQSLECSRGQTVHASVDQPADGPVTSQEAASQEAASQESSSRESSSREAIPARRARSREATWDALVAAVGCAAVAVVTIRMGMTGRPA
jgi:hypothetical protein